MTWAIHSGMSLRRAAYRGAQDGTQHRKWHPRGTRKVQVASQIPRKSALVFFCARVGWRGKFPANQAENRGSHIRT